MIADNGEYAVQLQDAEDNVFRGNDLDGGYFYSDGDSDNSVADSPAAGVAIGSSTARLRFESPIGRVYANDAGIPTNIEPEGSFLNIGRTEAPTPMQVQARPLAVELADGDLEVIPGEWSPARRMWTVRPGSATSARFVVGGLAMGQVFDVTAGTPAPLQLKADGRGSIEFDAELGDEDQVFVVESTKVGGRR